MNKYKITKKNGNFGSKQTRHLEITKENGLAKINKEFRVWGIPECTVYKKPKNNKLNSEIGKDVCTKYTIRVYLKPSCIYL